MWWNGEGCSARETKGSSFATQPVGQFGIGKFLWHIVILVVVVVAHHVKAVDVAVNEFCKVQNCRHALIVICDAQFASTFPGEAPID